jgi:muramoyltetrapeptide carboxypeptidase
MQPDKLIPGDTIAIVSTARKLTKEEIQPAIELLKSWGLNVSLGKNLFAAHNQFAGSDEERAEDLQAALNNPAIKAILFGRGGYGTVRIIDKIDFSFCMQHPKWLIGYSDVTVLHSHIHQLFGMASIHGPMAFNFKTAPPDVLNKLKTLLFNGHESISFPSQVGNRNGNAEGLVVGGNLSILYSLLGSISDIDTNEKILFIEDLDEYLYHIDRMMIALKRSGKLENLAGLIVGGMTDMKDHLVPFGKSAEEIILETVFDYNYPVCFGFPAGHIGANFPITLGLKAILKVDEICNLTITQ